MKSNKQIDIKRALALSATFNFLYCCTKACLLPFLTLYLRQQGLTPAMTGIVMGTKSLITLVWSPMASLLCKRYNKRRVLIVGSLVCSPAVVLLMLLIPQTDVHTRSSSCNGTNQSSSPVQSLGDGLLMSSVHPEVVVSPPANTLAHNHSAPNTTSKAPAHQTHPQLPQQNSSVVVNNSLQETSTSSPAVHAATSTSAAAVRKRRESGLKEEGGKTTEEQSSFLGSLKTMDPQHQLFFMMLLIVSVWEFVSAPLEWTADDGLYEYLDVADASDRYSSAGLWGLLGAACGVGGAGLLVSQLNCVIAAQTPRSAAHFYCYAGLTALVLPAASGLPLYLNTKRERATGLVKALQLVRACPRALLCAVTTLLAGAAGSAVENFLLWQVQDLGGTELHMGLTLSLALLSQAAFPLLAGRVCRLLSPGRLLAVAAVTLGLQCLYYSFLWAPWAALLAQMFTCFSSGALWWAVKVQCEDVATQGAERSVRRVYSALSLHLESALGSLAGGFAAQSFGLAWLFRGAAAGLMAWSACVLLLQWKAPRQRRINYSRLLAADASEASDSESEQERDWLDKAMHDDRSNNNYGRTNH